MKSVAKKAVRRHLRRIAVRAMKKRAVRRMVRKGKHVKKINYARPHHGSIMLV